MAYWPHKGYVEHKFDKCVDLSIAFTWKLQTAHQRAVWWASQGYNVRAGGPAVKLMPEILDGVADVSWSVLADAIALHNENAVFTSRGCVRRCKFCAVPVIEGELREIPEKFWEPRRIICDNNLLACSRKHFDMVIDRLKPLRNIDFQGLDARLLTRYHAERLAELRIGVLRLAWDHIDHGHEFMAAYEKLRKAKLPKKVIRCYVLIGYDDTPDDAWFRLRTIRNMGIMPLPMRYNPLDALRRDEYVGPNWTDDELRRYMRYWSHSRWHGGVPFEEFGDPVKKAEYEATKDQERRGATLC